MALPHLDGYTINQIFASGGMAKIYDAIQISLNRSVAIKFLSKDLLSHNEAKDLFERESLIIAKLNHPNIVQIIDKGITDKHQPYFVMEKIIGIDLSKMLEQGKLPFNKKLDIAIQICKGLAYAHKNGVIHRDIKPSNIIIEQHANVKILDFGIALTAKDKANEATNTSVMGTEGYVAPEQKENYNEATIASDIYSTGVVFNNLFTKDKLSHHPDTNEQETLSTVDSLIQKCCHRSPDKRYTSLTEVRDELLRISQGSHLGQNNIKAVNNENQDLANNFNLLDVLSHRGNKRVYLFQKKSNKQLLVIRRIFGECSGVKEARLLSSLKHPNIINIYAAIKSKKSSTIISEYLSGGSLSNQLIQGLSETEFLKQATQLCSAIDFAHQNNILHCNLVPGNILFDSKQNLKICDFGQVYSSNDNSAEIKLYQPPGKQLFSEQYDIYCLGAIFHHMLYGVPFNAPLPADTPRISYRLQRLIDTMLAVDPINRPENAQQILVELNKISNAEVIKQSRSTMGKARKVKPPDIQKPEKATQIKPPSTTKWLSIALTIAILCIISLVIKDFI